MRAIHAVLPQLRLRDGNGSLQQRESRPGAGPRLLRQQCVEDGDCGHCLYDGHGAGHDAGVVTALCLEDAFLGVVAGGGLRLADCGGGFEADVEVDVGAVGDAALDAAGVVGFCEEAGTVGWGGGGGGG